MGQAWFEKLEIARIATRDIACDYGAASCRARHGKKFRQHAIAAEELVAEIGASILGAHLRLPPQHIHDHASYIGHRMKLLADDRRAFLAAAAQTRVAVDWLPAKSPSPFAEEEAPDVAA